MRAAARQLLGLCAPAVLRDAQLGDLEEEYLERESADGSRAASLWYCSQALRSLGRPCSTA